ncbi:hypothetical protein CO251_05900 [Sulfobacillus sp. hq2]|nr:hypothetical protein CO251_05900 [Sulfobacillus sp. hq2]
MEHRNHWYNFCEDGGLIATRQKSLHDIRLKYHCCLNAAGIDQRIPEYMTKVGNLKSMVTFYHETLQDISG